MKSPCKGCPDRKLGCHSECGRYLAFVEACEKLRKIRNDLLHLNALGPRFEKNLRNKLNREKKK